MLASTVWFLLGGVFHLVICYNSHALSRETLGVFEKINVQQLSYTIPMSYDRSDYPGVVYFWLFKVTYKVRVVRLISVT